MNEHPKYFFTQSSLEEQATVILERAVDTIHKSLDALQLSIRSQEHTVGAMRRLNERGLQSEQDTRMLEETVGQLIVGGC